MAPHDKRERRRKPREKGHPSLLTRFRSIGSKMSGKTKTNGEKPKKEDAVSGDGMVLQNRAGQLGKVAAWAVVAFVLIVSVVSTAQMLSPSAPVAQVVEEDSDTTSQQAADYARGYVGAWLRATAEDSSELDQYRTVTRGEITETEATEFRDLGISSATMNDEGVHTVVISAKVRAAADPEAAPDPDAAGDEEAPALSWVPAQFQINVYQQGETFSPVGWPTPVPPADTGTDMQAEYRNKASAEITDTVKDFMVAYALGDGDVTRLTHPDSTIRPLSTSTYTYADVYTVTANEEHGDVPEDGTAVRVLADVALGAGEEAARSTTYALTLETRGGRWEVKTLDAAPALAPEDMQERGVTEDPQNPETPAAPSPETAAPAS